jgi:hypothetical protein
MRSISPPLLNGPGLRSTNIKSKTRSDSSSHCFTSKRLAGDQLPGVPEEELARTRHHILIVGSVLVVNCETVVFWLTTSGEPKVSESSIWIV